MSELQLRSQRHHKPSQRISPFLVINWILFLIEIGLLTYLGFVTITNRILQLRNSTYVILAVVFVVVLLQLTLLLLKKLKVVNFIFLLLCCLGLAYTNSKFSEVVSLFNTFSKTENVSEYTMSIAVLNDSSITSVEQLKGATVEAPTTFDKENIDALFEKIKSDKNITLSTEEVDSYHTAYLDLLSGKATAVVMNSSFESLLETQHPDFYSKIRKIYEFKKQQVTVQRQQATTTQKTDVFNLYLSGIDTYGAITEVSRSDVNIIATVNTKTRQILLTTTPRDSYVRIADGGKNQYDKLTHAGIYGVDASMHTLENLYDIQMDYYARINFTTFMQMVDIVGGVDVDIEYGFTSTTVEDLEFEAGKQTLNSYQALAYVRERYNLVDGDVGRAAHQQEVITDILKKLLSPVLLTNSTQIIAQLAHSAQTDMDLETVMVIINNYLDGSDSKGYTIYTQALEVEGVLGLPSYAMPYADLWMGKVDQTSLQNVQKNIERVTNGQTPIIESTTKKTQE